MTASRDSRNSSRFTARLKTVKLASTRYLDDLWEPIIRADERRHIEMGAVIDREVIADEVRERIAQEIEVMPLPIMRGPHQSAQATQSQAARIARDGTP